MRFFKVVVAFFLIGFFAGSLDTASGLGNLEQSRLLAKRNVDATIIRASTHALAVLPGQATELQPQALTLPDEVAAAVWAEFSVPPQVPPPAVQLKSMLFLPEEPQWWDERRRGGLPRMADFGPEASGERAGHGDFLADPARRAHVAAAGSHRRACSADAARGGTIATMTTWSGRTSSCRSTVGA